MIMARNDKDKDQAANAPAPDQATGAGPGPEGTQLMPGLDKDPEGNQETGMNALEMTADNARRVVREPGTGRNVEVGQLGAVTRQGVRLREGVTDYPYVQATTPPHEPTLPGTKPEGTDPRDMAIARGDMARNPVATDLLPEDAKPTEPRQASQDQGDMVSLPREVIRALTRNQATVADPTVGIDETVPGGKYLVRRESGYIFVDADGIPLDQPNPLRPTRKMV
jgi:hypothetical protein